MANFNRVIIVGNLTRDPEYKQLESGQGLCKLGIASNRQYRNKQSGEMVQEVLFVDIDVWGPQAESCNQYLQKGRSVLVEGRLKLDQWQDNEGQNRSKHSIVAERVVFLSNQQTDMQAATTSDSMGFESQSASSSASGKRSKKAQEAPGNGEFKDEPPFEDELPF